MCDVKFLGVLCENERLVPVEAISIAQKVMEEGKDKHGDRWKERKADYYINKAVAHLMNLESNNTDEDDLAHAMVDLILAVAIKERLAERGKKQFEKRRDNDAENND